MKTVLQHQELRQQQQAISAMYVLYSALSRTHDILVNSTNDYRIESDVFEIIKSIQGKSKKEVQQMRKTDSFLDMLVDEFLTAPYKEDFDQCHKKSRNTAKRNKYRKEKPARTLEFIKPYKRISGNSVGWTS